MTFSFRNHRERGVFELSAICMGGVFPVRARGCLSPHETETQPKSLNQVHASAPISPVPFLPARQLAASLRQQVLRLLRSQPFSSIVICMRELASVLLLRLSQSPRSGHGPNEFLGAFLKAPRSLTRPRFQLRQKFPRGPLVTFRPLPVLVLVHDKKRINGVQKCQTKEFPKTEKEFPRTP